MYICSLFFFCALLCVTLCVCQTEKVKRSVAFIIFYFHKFLPMFFFLLFFYIQSLPFSCTVFTKITSTDCIIKFKKRAISYGEKVLRLYKPQIKDPSRLLANMQQLNCDRLFSTTRHFYLLVYNLFQFGYFGLVKQENLSSAY